MISLRKRMYKRYHIETVPAKLPTKIGKFRVIRDEGCLNCGRCIDWCIYDVHRRGEEDPRMMADPKSHLCKNCFSCIQNCPQQALTMVLNRDYEKLGNSYWTPEKVATIWNEAEEGKLPVYGAGYRGPFRGSGFDDIWTDMSEIVRPTRDGIHGREYISTAVDMGRKLAYITDFDRLTSSPIREIQVPMLLDANPLGLDSKNLVLAVVKAAHELGTFALLDVDKYFSELNPYSKSIALRGSLERVFTADFPLWKEVSVIEVLLPSTFSNDTLGRVLDRIKKDNPKALISLALHDPGPLERITEFFSDGKADILSFVGGNDGQSQGRNLFITEAVRRLHLGFVKKGIRDEMTILGKGGIAAAEHVPKLIICGADAVVIDCALLVASGCRVCADCQLEACPASIAELESEFCRQRMVNMVGAWRDQLLEVLGAMGIRDVRRLRGEVGRAMFYEEIEKECFDTVFNSEVRSK